MPFIDELKTAVNKGFYLLSHLNEDRYEELCLLPKPERQQLVQALVNSRFSYYFPELIAVLTRLCFVSKGVLFIRGGASDFLGDLLQYMVLSLDGDKITDPGYISAYQPHDEIKEIFFCLYQEAQTFPDDHIETLPINIVLKVFNPLVVQSKTKALEELVPLSQTLQQIITEKDSCKQFLHQLTSSDETARIHHLELAARNRILSMKAEILAKTWPIERQFIFFKSGEEVSIEGQRVRVPDNIAAVLRVINDFEANHLLPSHVCEMLVGMDRSGLIHAASASCSSEVNEPDYIHI